MATPFGTAVSTNDFIIPPAPYVVSDVQVTGRLAFATPSTVTVSTANKVGLMLFDGLSCGIGAPANAMASRNGPC